MSMIDEIKERREFSGESCIFCDRDPYERVDVGVGLVPVAVTCCEPGIDLYQHHDKGLMNLSSRLWQMEEALLAADALADAAWGEVHAFCVIEDSGQLAERRKLEAALKSYRKATS